MIVLEILFWIWVGFNVIGLFGFITDRDMRESIGELKDNGVTMGDLLAFIALPCGFIAYLIFMLSTWEKFWKKRLWGGTDKK